MNENNGFGFNRPINKFMQKLYKLNYNKYPTLSRNIIIIIINLIQLQN